MNYLKLHNEDQEKKINSLEDQKYLLNEENKALKSILMKKSEELNYRIGQIENIQTGQKINENPQTLIEYQEK